MTKILRGWGECTFKYMVHKDIYKFIFILNKGSEKVSLTAGINYKSMYTIILKLVFNFVPKWQEGYCFLLSTNKV